MYDGEQLGYFEHEYYHKRGIRNGHITAEFNRVYVLESDFPGNLNGKPILNLGKQDLDMAGLRGGFVAEVRKKKRSSSL